MRSASLPEPRPVAATLLFGALFLLSFLAAPPPCAAHEGDPEEAHAEEVLEGEETAEGEEAAEDDAPVDEDWDWEWDWDYSFVRHWDYSFVRLHHMKQKSRQIQRRGKNKII